MNKDEALKLALEALEAIGSQYICRSTHHTKAQQHGVFETCPNELTHEAAITAIKEALAQPQQEPVACMVENDDYGVMVWPIEDINEAGTYCEENEFPVLLYTSPPQRKPLTFNEITAIEEKVYMQTTHKGKPAFEYAHALIRAVEAAHDIKEKNT
jgi:hypothetical protein